MNNAQDNRQGPTQGYPPYQQGPAGPYEQPGMEPKPRKPYKSPALATLLSLFPGMGQAYLGYYQLGFTYVLIMAVCISVLSMGIMGPFFGPLLAFFWIFNLVDANRRAHNYNRMLDGMDPDQLHQDFEMPKMRGSKPLGILLVVVGALILVDLNEWFSLEFLENWWPLALVAGGAWLVLKDRKPAE